MARELVAGKYKLIRLLGRGGMGEVHEATHLSTGRRVAVKLLTFVQTTGDDDPNRLKEVTTRFYREARATGQIDSPHVVEILDAGADEESLQPFIVMEYLTGNDLQQVLKRTGTLNVQTALKVTAQAALGLAKAHVGNIIHRDIKPANIFLAQEEATGRVVVKLVDFGIARLKTEEGHDLTQDLTRTGSMLGSPTYMAPEQARGLKSIDGRVDVWSLGIVLYKLLTGTTPHERGEGGLGELLIRICVVPAPSVQERAPWIPPGVAQVVHRALKLDPTERYASGQEFYEALLPLIEGGSLELDESVLAGATDEERSFVAAKADISSVSLTQRGSAVSGLGDDGLPHDQTRMTMSGGEGYYLAKRGKTNWLLGGAAAGLLLIGGAGVIGYGQLAKKDDGFQGRAPASMPSGYSPNELPALPSIAPAPPEIQKAYLRVPKKSKVTVDGKPVTVEDDSTVLLEGELGSAFVVIVSNGSQSGKGAVAIVRNPAGVIVAAPGTVEYAPRGGGGTRGDKPKDPTGPTTAPTKPDPGIDTTFR